MLVKRDLRSPPSAGVMRFVVWYTGDGIETDNVDEVFETITQADASTTRKYGGTGLGLSISKRLVEMMGGEITVEGVLGQGSTFTFTARFGAPSAAEGTD